MTRSATKRLLAIGIGKFSIDCIKIIEKMPGAELALVITPPDEKKLGMSLADYCAKKKIPFLETDAINSEEVFQTAADANVDLGFSLSNFSIIKDTLLKIPKEGFINFHNGPLPRYAGVNVCSWAIINAENEYGVTWHYMDGTIDTGDIIAQKTFPISKKETARTLSMQCIKQGVSLFKELLPELICDKACRHPQSDTNRSYFGLKKTPNEGYLDFSWSYKRIDHFVRGLNFYPFPNDFVYPASHYNEHRFFILAVKKINEHPSTGKNGEIVSLGTEHIEVMTSDASVGLLSILSDSYQLLNPAEFTEQYQLEIGGRFE